MYPGPSAIHPTQIDAEQKHQDGPTIIKEYDDGFVVRAMTLGEKEYFFEIYKDVGIISRYDTEVPMKVSVV